MGKDRRLGTLRTIRKHLHVQLHRSGAERVIQSSKQSGRKVTQKVFNKTLPFKRKLMQSPQIKKKLIKMLTKQGQASSPLSHTV